MLLYKHDVRIKKMIIYLNLKLIFYYKADGVNYTKVK